MEGTVVQAIETATLEVFAMMVGVNIIPETQVPQAACDPESNVVSSFHLSGSVTGMAEVFYALPLAQRITCQMLQVEPPAQERDVLDAAGEVANMIVGNVKNSLETQLGAISIGTPTVALARHGGIADRATSVRFRCCEDVFTVSVAFKADPSRWDS